MSAVGKVIFCKGRSELEIPNSAIVGGAASTCILTVCVSVCAELHWVSVCRRTRLRSSWNLRQRMFPPAVPLHGSARCHQLHRLLLTDALLHDDSQVWEQDDTNDAAFCFLNWTLSLFQLRRSQSLLILFSSDPVTQSLCFWSTMEERLTAALH